jgi:Glucodextranase, domain B
VKPRIPLAYAGLLVIALVAVVGFAAFSPSSGSPDDTAPPTQSVSTDVDAQASARVASAVLALRVSDADSRTATTATTEATTTTTGPTTTTDDASVDAEALAAAPVETTTSVDPTTTATTDTAPPSTVAKAPADTTPPALSITSPDDGATVDDHVVTFEGTTEPGASVSSGPYAANVDDDGHWSLMLVVADGPNGALFTATDDAGNTTSKRIVVYHDAPATTTTTKPATTTTTQPSVTTTTSAGPKWSPLWPADAGGKRDVEAWRPLVAQYWPAELVDCALNLIDLESQGDPRAYNSSVGAEGLFQHLSKYWKGRAKAAGFYDPATGLYATPYNAEANIAAAWHIAKNSSPWNRPWSVDPFYGACAP